MRRLVLAIGLVGCEQVVPLDVDEACFVPDDVQEIFDRSCVLSGCHGDGVLGAGLSLADGRSDDIARRSSTQVSSLPLVEIGNVAGSYLAIKIQDDIPAAPARIGDLMPPGGGLPGTERSLILGWIAGAQLECTVEGETSTTGAEMPTCSIEGLKPGAPDPIDAGTNAGQIPPDIATVLADNCGCHYVDDLENIPDYLSSQPLHIDTLSGFDEDIRGILAHALVSDRLTDGVPAMPPPVICPEMPAEERELLLRWLDAGHPDGATWSP